jgi:hypothetical protein
MWTEEEARTKDCRIAGVIERNKAAVHSKCCASGCMGWVPTQLPIPATYSIVSGKLITEAQPGKGRCGYAK